MAVKFAFVGDIPSLSPRQQEFLCEILERKGYKDNQIHIEPIGTAGDNYVASIKRITVNGNDSDTFKIVAKVTPTWGIAQITKSTPFVFNNETIYTEVFPNFAKLQKAANVSEDECLQYADCYGVLTEELDECILLEDLQVSNFEMLDRYEPLTNESVKLILKHFAILHSLSFVLKKKEPKVFEYFSKKLFDNFSAINSDTEYQNYLTVLENDTLVILDSENYKKAVRNTLSQMGAISKKVFKMEAVSRYNVIVQGSGWFNNIMFRLEDNKPAKAIIIDYQESRVTSPVVDLLYMIFTSTDHSTRLNHYYDWLDYYHSILDKSLSNYGLKANYEYPRDQLDADLRRYSKIFFGSAILLSSALIRKIEDTANIKEVKTSVDPEDMTSLNSKSVTLFKKRVEDLINSYREFGYMD